MKNFPFIELFLIGMLLFLITEHLSMFEFKESEILKPGCYTISPSLFYKVLSNKAIEVVTIENKCEINIVNKNYLIESIRFDVISCENFETEYLKCSKKD